MATYTILRRKEVQVRTGLSRTALYEKINSKSQYYDPEFPKPIPLNGGGAGRAVGWLDHEIDAWIERQITKRDARTAA
jgi:prophage regulatory protein